MSASPDDEPSAVTAFFGRFRTEILEDWAGRAAATEVGVLARPELIDHIPQVLDRIIEVAALVEGGTPAKPDVTSHVLSRLRDGFSLQTVVLELALLRDSMTRVWHRERGLNGGGEQLRAIHRAVDAAIESAVEQSMHVQRSVRLEADRVIAKLDGLLAASPVGIAFVDTSLRYLRINEALAAVNGKSVEEHIGRRIDEVMPRDAAFIGPVIRHIIETGERMTNVELYASPPSSRHHARSFLASLFPVRTPSGEILGAGIIVVEVSELKEAQARAERNAAELEAVIEHMPAAVFLGNSERVTRWNRNARDLLGEHDAPTAAGAPLALFGERLAPREPGTNRPLAPEEFPLARALAGETCTTEVVVHDARTGGDRYVSVASGPVLRDHEPIEAVSVLVDVHERRRSENNERFLSDATKLLSASLDHRITLDRLANLVVPRLADWCIVDLVTDPENGKKVHQLAMAHADPNKLPALETLARRRASWLEERGRGPTPTLARVIESGEPEHVAVFTPESLNLKDADDRRLIDEMATRSLYIAPLRARDRTLGALTFAQAESGRAFDDVDRALMSELARRAGAAVDNAQLYAQAQRAVRTREEVLAIVSHDLKSPLSAVSMAAGLLHKRLGGDPSGRTHVEMIQRASKRMDRLINDLLDMASIQAGRLAVVKKLDDIAAIVREGIDEQRATANAKDIIIDADLELDALQVHCDRRRILQLLGNLLGNAVKFSPRGSRIVVKARVVRGNVEVSITDQGTGIRQELLSRLFEPFWSAPEHAEKGTGLGLTISKGIVDSHGGTLSVASTVGVGTTFTFTLPIDS